MQKRALIWLLVLAAVLSQAPASAELQPAWTPEESLSDAKQPASVRQPLLVSPRQRTRALAQADASSAHHHHAHSAGHADASQPSSSTAAGSLPEAGSAAGAAHNSGAHSGGVAGAAAGGPRATYQDTVVERYAALYRRYGADLKAAKALGAQHFSSGFIGLSFEIEVEATYLRLRAAQPEVVWEISPHSGYSTIFILAALEANGRGHLYSFDIWNASLYNTVLTEKMKERWTFVHGDAKENAAEHLQRAPPDYLILDSFHARAFGEFYTERLMPALRAHTYVSVHDVYFVGKIFWSDASMDADGKYVRDMGCYPQWMPNEEGLTIIDWLAFQEHACNVFTASKQRQPGTYEAWAAMRAPVMGGAEDPLLAYAREHKLVEDPDAWNPTIWFELNCDVRLLR